MAQAVFDAKAMAHNLTLTVRIQRMAQWRWRIKLGFWLIQLAAWVMWVNIEIDEEG